MPPISGAPAGIASFGSGFSATIASVVISRPATEAAFCKDERTTFVGSITPALIMSVNSLVFALKPTFSSVPSISLPTMTEPSAPAFSAMLRAGAWIARRTISTPTSWSRLAVSIASSADDALTSAKPPPGTMPSSTAARVACIASSTRSLRSFTSTSVAPPTLITATPPASLARRSCSFSRS